jgi:ribonuclease HI
MEKRMFVYTDGGARGNPGKAAIGIIILDENERVIETYKEFFGVKTNNETEYLAVIKALELVKKYSKKVHICSDSELVIKQINGEYKIKKKELKALFDEVEKREKEFEEVSYSNVARENEYIQEADKLVNQELDMHEEVKVRVKK